MKVLFLSLFLFACISHRSGAQSVWEWTLDNSGTGAVIGDGLFEWSTLEAHNLTTYATTNGTTVPHIGGTPAGYVRFPAFTNPADFAKLTFNGSVANGGGLYINQYTIIMDVYLPAAHDWLAFFNTNTDNANDADFYIKADGSLGIGALGYSTPGTVTVGAWHRLIFAADLAAGIVTYYRDGVQVFQRTSGDPLFDGRFSLYSGTDAGPDLILGNEGDASGVYTAEWLLAAFAFTDRTLTAVEAAALGTPKAIGIFYTGAPPPPPALRINLTMPDTITLDWDEPGFLLQRSTDLSAWSVVAGSAALTTHSEPAGDRVYFRLATAPPPGP